MSCAFAWLILVLSHTALAGKGENRLVRLKEGESFTISCNPSIKPQESLILRARLDKNETQVLNLDLNTKTFTTIPVLKHRLSYTENGDSYNLLITISNLTVEDTKIYWCEYSLFDRGNILMTDGGESVLLVVDATDQCDATKASSLSTYLLFGLASIFCTLLLIGLIVYICPKKKARRAKKRVSPTRTNDVYEDMRATIRR
ncbi:uncharacterized protein LOC134037756 isoform X2 [Osmerus eperlanus]|uniref:uncharacterized protein LOC134037756 isoform X2 n=1 Tax=Osmerus eperlanus TaxID=29151 RepID=UPI002E1017FF